MPRLLNGDVRRSKRRANLKILGTSFADDLFSPGAAKSEGEREGHDRNPQGSSKWSPENSWEDPWESLKCFSPNRLRQATPSIGSSFPWTGPDRRKAFFRWSG